MDLWVVAAAAGAGYIAKNVPNFSLDKKEGLGGSSLKYSHNLQPGSRNFLQQLRDTTCPSRRLAQKTVQDNTFLDLENHSEIDRASSRDGEVGVVSVNGDYSDKTGILEGGFITDFSAGENQQYGDCVNKNSNGMDGSKVIRNRRFHMHWMRPLSTTKSCMDNIEHRSCLHPSMSTVAPVLVTDKCSSSSLKQLEELTESKNSPSSFQKSGFRNGVAFDRSSPSQGAEKVLLFVSGMTVGILTATTWLKNEADKLNMQLNQMQNLVRDLHEKQTVMVKELDDKGDPITGEVVEEDPPLSNPSPSKYNEFVGVKENYGKAENLELLSRIEAELQAELEMLEQNIKTSQLERTSRVVQLGPDFEPEIVRGDLKVKTVKDESNSGSTTADRKSDYSKPVNYAVPPLELSLRLHELIESRLEMSIKELEIALSQSENRVASGNRLSYSGTETSSTHPSPTCISDEHDKRENGPSTGNSFSNCGESGSSRTQNGDYDFISHGTIIGDYVPQIWDEQELMSLIPNEDSMSEDEGSDESEMLLIKQIIERRKSGSSFNF